MSTFVLAIDKNMTLRGTSYFLWQKLAESQAYGGLKKIFVPWRFVIFLSYFCTRFRNFSTF
jgi:hypothetical protein